jgi:hypothetical protein
MITAVKERPILFSGSMVLANLKGIKTATRRPITRLLGFGNITEFGPSDTPGYDWHFRDKKMRWHDITHDELLKACPYGQPGDHLWGRESFWDYGWHAPRLIDGDDSCPWISAKDLSKIKYVADHPETPNSGIREPYYSKKPSIHMPRWASRLLLEVADRYPERLNEISDDDAFAEGISTSGPIPGIEIDIDGDWWAGAARNRYKALWESINGPGSFDNKLVWVIKYKPI